MSRRAVRRVRVAGENVRFALRAIAANRLRASLTSCAIVIGVVTVVTMVAIVQGFKAGVVESMTSFGATLVQFQKYEPRFGPDGHNRREGERERRDLTLEDAIAIKRLAPSIAAVSPERYLFPFPEPVPVRAEGKEAQGPIIAGVYPDYMLANNHFVADGRFFTDADVLHATEVAVIGNDVVQAIFPGKDALGRRIEIGGRKYTVVGVFERKGSAFGGSNDNFVMVPLSSFDKQFPYVKKGGDTIHIATVPKRPEWVDRAIEEGTAILRARRGLRPEQPNDFAIYTPDKLIAQMSAIVNGVSLVMIIIASIALLVGGVGVMNIMLVAVTERTREIGVRMALGGRRRDIVLQFLTEASTLSGLGGLIGIAVSLGLVALVSATGLLPAEAPVWAMALGLGVSIAVGLFFGLFPAVRAARLDPIDALRYE